MLKHTAIVLALTLGLSAGVWAQGGGQGVNPPVATSIPQQPTQFTSIFGGNSELFIGGGAQFARATQANSVPLSTTNVPSGQVDFRFHVNDWTAIGVRYAIGFPVQSYGNAFHVRARSQEFSFEYVVTVPTQGGIRPFLEVGPGLINFTPQGSNNTPGAQSEKKATLNFGGGLNFPLTRHFALRLEYRGLMYRVPDFHLITIGKWNLLSEPDIGLVWHFNL